MNDPTNWNLDVDTGSFEFASPEEAKRAEAILNKAMRESYANGYATAIETAAQVADEMDCAMLCGVGHEVGTRIRAIADAPTPSLSGDQQP